MPNIVSKKLSMENPSVTSSRHLPAQAQDQAHSTFTKGPMNIQEIGASSGGNSPHFPNLSSHQRNGRTYRSHIETGNI